MPRDVQSVFTNYLQPNEPLSDQGTSPQSSPSSPSNQEQNQAAPPSAPAANNQHYQSPPASSPEDPAFQDPAFQNPIPPASSPEDSAPASPLDQPTENPHQTNVLDQRGWQQAPLQPQPEYLLLEWEADSRVSQKRSKEYYSSLAVIVLLVSLILFFAGQTLLIFVVWAFLFVSYVLASVKAESVVHQVTTYGIRYRSEKLIYWEQMGRFWFRENHGHVEIHIEAPSTLGNELILLAPNKAQNSATSEVNLQDIIDVFSRYLVYEEPVPSQLDRWVMWLQDKFPLE